MRSVSLVLQSCVVAILTCGTPPTTTFASSAVADTKDLLLRYASGDFAVVDKADKFDAASVRKDLERLSAEFLSTPSLRPDLPRRTLACFSLEVAAATFTSQFPESMRLLDWTRQRLIGPTTAPGEFERHWHLASIGLIEEAGDHAALEHAVESARQQFPDEPRVRLAYALAAELRAAANGANWTEPVSRFEHAAALDAARAEAQLHLAYVELRQDHQELAIEHLNAGAGAVGDPATTYLLHLLQGRALAALKKEPEAVAAYQAALTDVPGAQSATMGLAVMLVQRGERNRANDVVDVLLKSKPVDDPWWHYWNLDYRFRDRRIADLRGDLK